jgi:TRAP-type C4-dicarboxylate transport system substrate-binding protein
MQKLAIMISAIMFCILGLAAQVAAKRYELRIATVAPQGSTWVNVFDAFRWELRKKSKNRLHIRLYTGGVQGDEKLTLSKIRLNSLQGAAITSVGLAQIEPSLLALQLPFLFRNYRELDFVRQDLDSHFREKLNQKGFVLMGWADMGYIYLFSKKELKSMDDLRTAKIWAWSDDPLTQAFAQQGGLTPHLLGLLHVRQSLQTGSIDTVAATPLTLIAMQWHSYVNYRIRYRFAIGIAATVISKSNYDKLPPDLQKLLLETSQKYHQKLLHLSRRDDRRALQTLEKRNLKGITLDADHRKQIQQISNKVRQHFIGKLYSKEDLQRILDSIQRYRKQRKQKRSK